MDWEQLDAVVDDYARAAASCENAASNWPAAWELGKEAQAGFRTVRYPTRQERDDAWGRFSGIRDNLQERRDEIVNTSQDILAEIQEYVRKSSINGYDDVFDFGTRSESDYLTDWKEDLQSRNTHLNEARGLLRDRKEDLLPKHRHEGFEAIRDAQEDLNADWARYRERRADNFRDMLTDKRARLETALERLQSSRDYHNGRIEELEEKAVSARSEEFRGRVEEWIQGERVKLDDVIERIEDVSEKISNINNQISDL